jgi:hypothetical protein
LFVALIVLVTMNLVAMTALAALLTAEKLWVHGPSRSLVPVAGVALAVVVLLHPSTAPGLYLPVAPMGM